MSKVKSPLRYPGGKSRVADNIVDLFPRDIKEYREPFLGGGSVFLSILQNQEFDIDKFWINDINESLMAFWQSAFNSNTKMINEINEHYKVKNKSLYEELKETTFPGIIKEGARFFVLNRITFSGTVESGGYSKSAHAKRFTQSSIDRVQRLSELNIEGLNLEITNLDFEKTIAETGDDVFIFLDPPYLSAENSRLYGVKGDLHKGFDHQKLFDLLSNTEHRWLMTYDNSKEIRDLYKDFYQSTWTLQYGMSKKRKNNNELIISNYKIEQV